MALELSRVHRSRVSGLFNPVTLIHYLARYIAQIHVQLAGDKTRYLAPISRLLLLLRLINDPQSGKRRPKLVSIDRYTYM